MPKKSNKSSFGGRGAGGRKVINVDSQGKDFFGHDDRMGRDMPMKLPKGSGGIRHQVCFKDTDARRMKSRVVNWADWARTVDIDCPMSGSNNNGREVIIQRTRNRGTARGGNSPLSHRGGMGSRHSDVKRSTANDTVWFSSKTQSYRVTIPFGHRYERSFIMSKLFALVMPDSFVPIMYKVTDTAAVFYVDNLKIANALKSCDRKILASDGFKLGIRVDPGFPPYNVDQTMKDKMKQAMAKRYVADTNALDLSRFHLDPELVEEYYCALARPSILIAALDIVAAVIPNLEALNLDNNQLHSFEKLTTMTKKLSCIKILYLAENKIREVAQLNPIKELPLEEIRLVGNPVCEKYKGRHDDYVSDMRNRFPKLLRLDGVELPRPIGFDVENEGTKLPETQRMFIANAKAQEIASQFLQQYFIIFDSDNRQPLLDAYHEQACFSLTLSSAYSSNKFNNYHAENRNLKRVVDVARRKKLLKLGRLPVVSYIAEMPRTQHDLSSFTMDICLVTEAMMVITVAGLFKEPETKDEPIRYFNRTFIIVPEGSGYCIRNEQLHITHPTHMQEKRANQPPTVRTPAPEAVAGPATPSTSVASPVTDEVRQQMTLTLSQHTNMNLEWSLKCLKEVDWNFDMALAAFQEFFKLGRIPPEAFKK